MTSSFSSGDTSPLEGINPPTVPRAALESELAQAKSLLASATHLVSELRQENLALKHALIAANEEAKKLQEEVDTLSKGNKKDQKQRGKNKKKKANKEKRTLADCLRRARSDKRATVAISSSAHSSSNTLRDEGEPENASTSTSSPTASSPDWIIEQGEDVPPPSRDVLLNENRRALELIENPLPSGVGVAEFLEETDNLLNHLQSKRTAVNYTAQGLHRLIGVYEQTGEPDLKRIAIQALDEKKDIIAALSYFIANITAKRNQLLGLAPNPFSPDGNVNDPPLPPPIDDQVSEALENVMASMPGKPEPVVAQGTVAPPLPAM